MHTVEMRKTMENQLPDSVEMDWNGASQFLPRESHTKFTVNTFWIISLPWNVCSVSFQEIPGVIRGLICFDTPGRRLGWLGKGSCFIPMVFFWKSMKSDVSERGPSNPWIVSDHHFISCSIIFPYIFRNWMAITRGYWYPIFRQPLDLLLVDLPPRYCQICGDRLVAHDIGKPRKGCAMFFY